MVLAIFVEEIKNILRIFGDGVQIVDPHASAGPHGTPRIR